jgi:AcrR family transcriptional regulator
MRAARILPVEVVLVNRDKGHKRTQAERSATTRAALLTAARALFAERGYAATGREDIAAAAGVTRGALYHHFPNKEAVFRAVFEDLEAEMMEHVIVAADKATDPLGQIRLGTEAYLDAALDPAVQRILLTDAPAVLPLAVRHEVAEAHVMGAIRLVLTEAIKTGQVAKQPVEPLPRMLMAALHEAAIYVAESPNHKKARKEMGTVVNRVLRSLTA